jgi:hypothetical protein
MKRHVSSQALSNRVEEWRHQTLGFSSGVHLAHGLSSQIDVSHAESGADDGTKHAFAVVRVNNWQPLVSKKLGDGIEGNSRLTLALTPANIHELVTATIDDNDVVNLAGVRTLCSPVPELVDKTNVRQC